MREWARYKVLVKWSVWGTVLYASSKRTAESMAAYYKGTIVKI